MTKHSIITRAKGVVVTTPGDFKDTIITIGGQKFTQDEFNELSKTVQSHMEFIKGFNRSLEESSNPNPSIVTDLGSIPPEYVLVKTYMGMFRPYCLYMIPKPFDPVKWSDIPAWPGDHNINLHRSVENESLPSAAEAYDCVARYKTVQRIVDSAYTEFWTACGGVYDVASDTTCPKNSQDTRAIPYFKVIRVNQVIKGN